MASVAIVNDERSILISLAMALEAEGFVTDTYDDPIVALPKLILVPPSVLVLNGRMPRMHGIEFFLTFRDYCRAPVIFLSASADDIEAQMQAMGTPAAAYVGTPYSQRGMIRLVRDVLAAKAETHSGR